MSTEITLDIKDKVLLTSGKRVSITEAQSAEPYLGVTSDGNAITFTEKEIDCISKDVVNSCGGDDTTFWYFYCGSSYKYNTLFWIANWAKYNLLQFVDLSIDEIMHKHIYFGSDGYGYKAMYNGDTYVLFTNIDKLDADHQADAKHDID